MPRAMARTASPSSFHATQSSKRSGTPATAASDGSRQLLSRSQAAGGQSFFRRGHESLNENSDAGLTSGLMADSRQTRGVDSTNGRKADFWEMDKHRVLRPPQPKRPKSASERGNGGSAEPASSIGVRRDSIYTIGRDCEEFLSSLVRVSRLWHPELFAHPTSHSESSSSWHPQHIRSVYHWLA